MTAISGRTVRGRVRQVGRVVTDVSIVNREDVGLADRGFLERDRVRRVALRDVLVDTGATMPCLPIDVIRTLGLPFIRTVEVATAAGVQALELYDQAQIVVEGRTSTFECMALAEGTSALLGVLPLEAMGLEPDLQNQALRLLPDTGKNTYLLAY